MRRARIFCGVAGLAWVLGGCSDTGRGTDSEAMTASGGGTADTGVTGEFKLDVSFDNGDVPDPQCASGECSGCTAIDLLFVVDNSVSMEAYQVSLGQAFPAFSDAIFGALPAGTNLHIGVTSTSFGQSVNSVPQGCGSTGDGNRDAAEFYVTPDVESTGVNGAQGRLFVTDGIPYFNINTSADQGGRDALKAWFRKAVLVGTDGSQIEMSSAAAGWALDGANASVNGNFVRDEGAVLVLFFIQDEPDQTPSAAADDLIAKIEAAKEGCGGMDCVVGGGFVNIECMPETPLGDMLERVGGAIVQPLPFPDELELVQKFEDALRGSLTDIIADACEFVTPAG